MNTLLMLDLETTGLDPAADGIIEIGVVLWSVQHGTTIAQWSDLVRHDGNAAENINAIPADALPLGLPLDIAMVQFLTFVLRADAIVAHNAEFDSSFLPDLGRPWICSEFDITWPHSRPGAGLVHVALAHGVAVTSAHRALTDCRLLADIFTRVHESGADIPAMLQRAMRPKATFAAEVSYDDREKAKAAGFKWEPDNRRWVRRMAIEDAANLPFKTRRVE